MLINEIFSSIEGEGKRSGYLATFIRTFGCNLKCSYCDTMYAVEPTSIGETVEKNCFELSIDEIINKCEKFKNKRITLTGGEPLIQKETSILVLKLLELGYEVNIETNGSINIKEFEEKITKNGEILSNLFYTLDYKCPTSKMEDKMFLQNIDFLDEKDVLKFVVASDVDLNKAKEIIEKYKPKANVYFSPVFDKIKGAKLVEFISENNLQTVKIQAQLHKIFWNPNQKGV